MQRVLLIAAFSLGLVLPFAAFGQEAGDRSLLCKSGNDADIATLLRQARPTNIQRLDDRAKDSATNLFNSEPPESDEQFLYAWVADIPAGGLLVFGSEAKGCVAMMIPAENWPRIKNIVLGRSV